MNIDGKPIDPADIERVLRRLPGVRDAAVFTLPASSAATHTDAASDTGPDSGPDSGSGSDSGSDSGTEQLWAALETDTLIDEIIVNAFCRKHLGPLTPQTLLQLRHLPRTDSGALQPDLLIAYAQELNAHLPDA